MSIDKKKPDTSPADGVNTAADEAACGRARPS